MQWSPGELAKIEHGRDSEELESPNNFMDS